MTRQFSWVARAYRVLALGVIPAVLAGALLVLFVEVSPDRRASAWAALRGDPGTTGEEARRLERRHAELAETNRRLADGAAAREAELRRREMMAEALLARALASQAAAPSPAAPVHGEDFESNVDLLNRMEPGTAAGLVKAWDDAAVGAYVRAMKPARAAEVVNRLAADPEFKERLPRILGAGRDRKP
ncbi:MAG TPA: hypothetical protein VGK61_01150 [Planctomycetota bacterium]|jgi:hypothetical protein